MTIRRFPSWIYRHGTEPDPRFSLANERTFLAWIRTSVALFAAGVALEALVLPIDRHLRGAAAIMFVLVGLGGGRAVLAGMGADRAGAAARTALPGLPSTAVLTAGVVASILVVVVGLLR